MKRVLMFAALACVATSVSAKPFRETDQQTMFAVCKQYAGPQANGVDASTLQRLDENAAEAVRRAILQKAMDDHNVDLRDEYIVTQLCDFYAQGVDDTARYVLDNMQSAERVASK